MRFGKTLIAGSAGVALILSTLFFQAIGQDRATTRGRASSVVSPAVQQAESLSAAFREAAEEVLPTVVKINTKTKARRVSRTREANPFDGTPFEDMFRDDFGFGGGRQLVQPPQEGMGSGVIIDKSGIVLTNNHVVENADEIVLKLADGREFTVGSDNVKTDKSSDLAVVFIPDAESLPAARLGDSDKLLLGDWVLAIGNPFGLEATVSAGIVSAKGRGLGSIERASFIQTDAAINPGNSGGPLVNLRGEVVGINTAILSKTGSFNGIGFAIPVNLARWVSTQLINKGEVARAYLGVGIQELTAETARDRGLDVRTKGVLVGNVGEDTPAARAGIEPDDVITHFGDQVVTTVTELQRAVERAPLNSTQRIRIIRSGRPMSVDFRAEELPDDFSLSRNPSYTNNEFGFIAQNITKDIARQLDIDDASGALIIQMDRDKAIATGLRPGMVITKVGNSTVRSVRDLKKAMNEVAESSSVVVQVKTRGNDERIIVLRR